MNISCPLGRTSRRGKLTKSFSPQAMCEPVRSVLSIETTKFDWSAGYLSRHPQRIRVLRGDVAPVLASLGNVEGHRGCGKRTSDVRAAAWDRHPRRRRPSEPQAIALPPKSPQQAVDLQQFLEGERLNATSVRRASPAAIGHARWRAGLRRAGIDLSPRLKAPTACPPSFRAMAGAPSQSASSPAALR